MQVKTLTQLHQDLLQRRYSSVELTQWYLQRIQRFDAQLNSYITLDADGALKQAQQADQRLAQGQATALTGIPIAYKDLFCTQHLKTSCGSKMLDNFIAPYDATVVARCQSAGAVCLGKTNMDEFAMGSSTQSSYYGPSRNPWDLQRVPGGSSGGSAVAVAAGLAVASIGSDTGGSIRQPAALCGVTGIKPTYGRVSRWGMVAYASSLDQGGPIAQTAEDAAVLLNVLCGHDAKDSTSIKQPQVDFTAQLQQSVRGLKVGVPQQYFTQALDPQIGDAVQAAIEQLAQMGAQICSVSLPYSELAIPAYYIIAPAEASTNLSRYDGVRFGYRCAQPKDLQDLYSRSRAEGLGEETKRRILMGTYVLSCGYYDAYYVKAQRLPRLIQQDFQAALAQVDVIVGPTTPNVAWPLGDKISDPVAMYLEDVYTLAVNLAGLPALSVPCGLVDGLPVGLQMIGDYCAEAKLLNVAHQFQQHSDWHLRHQQCTLLAAGTEQESA